MQHKVQIESFDAFPLTTRKIEQTNNENSTTVLWIQDRGTIFKQYTIENETSKRNKSNLLRICKIPSLFSISELVMPLSIVFNEKDVVGYTMPYISGVTLDTWLSSDRISVEQKLHVFQDLASCIVRLPNFVFLGDLHSKNVMIDRNGTVHCIDIDGFSLRYGYSLSSPMAHFHSAYRICRRHKYTRINGSLRISRDSDIFCFFIIFISWIMDVPSLIMYSENELFKYLRYLKGCNFPKSILDMIYRLFDSRHNYLNPNAFMEIQSSEIDIYRYSSFINNYNS